ncbi:MAG TPA: ABC transporter substrate-binding protein [Solirubrobacterales bacterium]|nr:ABC transporter substrate-binding protein [Solirubrobacterales bacterium]
MRSMLRWATMAAGIVALALSGCGGDDDRATGETGIPDQFAAPTAPPDDARPGGELTVIAADDIDFMDPGATYYQFTYMVTTAGHRTLMAWRPDDTDAPSPDLAEDDPAISDDGLVITFAIREGVRFSPPVDREVTAADVEYAIERGLLPGVANGYIPVYLSDVVGFAAAEAEASDDPTGGAPDIAGITAVDDRTLRIELKRPTSATVIQALSLPISAPVPEEYAREHDAENPSTYGDLVAFTGPYMVANDEGGELTGYTPGREIELVRNPNWDGEASGDFRPAYLDSIRIAEGFDDTASASRRILGGSGQVNGDISPPPTVIRDAAEDSEPGQLVASPSGGNRYITLNTQVPPFDDVDVRRAVFAATDRVALRNTRGGELIGPVASHFIPPEIPGFEEAGGVAGPDLDFVATPEGDPELAAEYMRSAGFESGRCEGDCEISVIGDGSSPSRETTEVFVDTLEQLGFEPQTRHVDYDVMLTRFCNSPEQVPHVCPSIGWLKDFNDPISILQPTFDGGAISDAGNTNLSLLDFPEINDAMAEAALIDDPDERAEAWGGIDTMIVEQAPAIPYTWDNQVNIRSDDVAGVINLFNANWDLAFTSMSG